jgi:hypothetical protein
MKIICNYLFKFLRQDSSPDESFTNKPTPLKNNINTNYHDKSLKDKINTSNTHDEDYLSEDQIDLNKYNY